MSDLWEGPKNAYKATYPALLPNVYSLAVMNMFIIILSVHFQTKNTAVCRW